MNHFDVKSLRAISVHLHVYTGFSEMCFGLLKWNEYKLIFCIYGTEKVLWIQKVSRIMSF